MWPFNTDDCLIELTSICLSISFVTIGCCFFWLTSCMLVMRESVECIWLSFYSYIILEWNVLIMKNWWFYDIVINAIIFCNVQNVISSAVYYVSILIFFVTMILWSDIYIYSFGCPVLQEWINYSNMFMLDMSLIHMFQLNMSLIHMFQLNMCLIHMFSLGMYLDLTCV